MISVRPYSVPIGRMLPVSTQAEYAPVAITSPIDASASAEKRGTAVRIGGGAEPAIHAGRTSSRRSPATPPSQIPTEATWTTPATIAAWPSTAEACPATISRTIPARPAVIATGRAHLSRTDEQEDRAQGRNARPCHLEQARSGSRRGTRAPVPASIPAASAVTSVAIAASARPAASSCASRRGIGPSRRTSHWNVARPRAASSPT